MKLQRTLKENISSGGKGNRNIDIITITEGFETHLVECHLLFGERKYISMVIFVFEEKARHRFVAYLMAEELIFLPTYIGRRVSRVRVEEISLRGRCHLLGDFNIAGR